MAYPQGKIYRYLIGFLFSFCPGAHANFLTWSKTIDLARTSNPLLLQKKENVAAAEARYRGSKSAYHPSLSAGLDASRSATESNGSTASSGSSGASLSLRYNLYKGGRDDLADREKQLRLRLLEVEMQRLKATLSYDLKKLFLKRLFTQRKVRLAKEIKQRREGNRSLVRLQYEAGKENRGSFLLASASVEKANWDKETLEVELSISMNDICDQLGKVECSYTEVSESIADLEVTVPEPANYKDLAKESLGYREKELVWEIAAINLEAARAVFFPQLDWSASFSQSGSAWFSGDKTWWTGLSLSIPLYSGGSDYYELMAKKSEVVGAEIERDHWLAKTTTSLRSHFAALKLASDKAKIDLTYLEAARLRATIARRKYNNGLISFEDWDTIENELISREQNMHESEMNRLIAEADWQLAIGKGAIE